MQHPLLKKYDYSFPPELIATQPASPRDSARLLVYNRSSKKTEINTFHNIDTYIPKNAVLVLNQTKVIPARLTLTKPTGGIVKILFIAFQNYHWEALSNKPLSPGLLLTLNKNKTFTVLERTHKGYILKPNFICKNPYIFLEKHGSIPLPPYIKNSPLSEQKLRTEYQTVFAKKQGSVAAPTASLHFTKSLLNKLKKQGVQVTHITLHVNIGTFASLTVEQIKAKKLHTEYFEIPKQTAIILEKAKKEGRPIIAVGTTVVRTLESAVDKNGAFIKQSGNTDLFLTETDTLCITDGIVTNFHVPQSSLLMLVSCFTGRKKLLDLYKFAIKNKFRLFSFGDGMLIL